MREFKIRCSQIGQIMTNDRSGKGVGKTVETYLENWVKSQVYNREIKIKSKYLSKGNLVESESIEFIGSKLKLSLSKNEQFFENDFLTGTPDVITDTFVIDVKNSWDWTTFPLFKNEIPEKNYYYQLQGYMALTGLSSAKLIYVLSNTPEEMIEREAWNECKERGLWELESYVYEEVMKDLIFDDVPDYLKFRVFDIERDDDVINSINERVKLCRKIIETKLQVING